MLFHYSESTLLQQYCFSADIFEYDFHSVLFYFFDKERIIIYLFDIERNG